MTTTSPIAARTPPGERHRELEETIHQYCTGVIVGEVERLARRRPTISASDRRLVEAILSALAERLLLDPVRRHPRHVDAIEALLAPETTRTEGDHRP